MQTLLDVVQILARVNGVSWAVFSCHFDICFTRLKKDINEHRIDSVNWKYTDR